MNFRVRHVIQSGLLNKWKQVFWDNEFRFITMAIKQKEESDEKVLTLNQVSTAFYSLLFCLPISFVVLPIEIIFFIKTR